jgi:hypothetical protein
MKKIQKAATDIGIKSGIAAGLVKGTIGSRGKTPVERALYAIGTTALGAGAGYLGGKYTGKAIGKKVEKKK